MKFKFGTKVIINTDFFDRCIGTVISEELTDRIHPDYDRNEYLYTVKVTDKERNYYLVECYETDLIERLR